MIVTRWNREDTRRIIDGPQEDAEVNHQSDKEATKNQENGWSTFREFMGNVS